MGKKNRGGYIPAARQKMIYEMVRTKGIVKVTELSESLNVSEITIRRDLDILERQGLLERTHGGAIFSQRMKTEPLYIQKNRIDREAKEAIGRTTAELIEDGDTLLINSGSTTLQVIRHLHGNNIRVITSNLGAVMEPNPNIKELILVGGVYRYQSNSLVGGFASLTLGQVYGTKAIIGVDGISVKYGLTTPVYQEAEVARMMIERTRGTVIVVADHRKLGVTSNFLTATIDSVDILVTDDQFNEEYRKELEEAGIRIVIAKNEGEKI